MMLWEEFDRNEIFVIAMLIIIYAIFFWMPKLFPRHITLLFLLIGFSIPILFDFTIGGGMLNFYQVNDSNAYELTDVLTYFNFAPFAYFYIYFYVKFNINKVTFIPYTFGWTVIGMVLEAVNKFMNVIHYQNGYELYYSVIIFIVVLTFTGLFYELVKKKDPTF
ncbi:hypothetical protein [Alkalibacillus haloalkaliphilus]|uniref:Uncharacterized protein n=1 Tax=Alkalibacillus haloalkaliphilus TaxID=94136 RepID=A0A511W7P0_9BACI|nr:hypothetical protein [Alkalibacillus haloalkaliphilus]GEN47110.1 hypothetical protein AHA02nite_28860 [Alkalibacillus haloalkaliphilus]